ncbi:DNA replication licensing factor Mcm2 [Arabidopsis thaliana x Arabidopsis arenosa]|uniref:DNA replication licensing factor Mcm2 n=1 Tax=Arabidopsis thaliana x Arabidopsis arenosa TaxID=1240361 RepID=A0A8T2CB97_9BRAS|nr:DNA replication licensing factor Mcm2 [Arabidopsis thaliana x Arabidopsis arenosa]
MAGEDFENNQPSVINIDDEEEGEDLFMDNFMEDYIRIDGHDQYDDLDQIIHDRFLVDAILGARETRNHNNDNFIDVDAAGEVEDLQIIRDEPEEEEEGEDLFNENFLEDYRHMDGHE